MQTDLKNLRNKQEQATRNKKQTDEKDYSIYLNLNKKTCKLNLNNQKSKKEN